MLSQLKEWNPSLLSEICCPRQTTLGSLHAGLLRERALCQWRASDSGVQSRLCEPSEGIREHLSLGLSQWTAAAEVTQLLSPVPQISSADWATLSDEQSYIRLHSLYLSLVTLLVHPAAILSCHQGLRKITPICLSMMEKRQLSAGHFVIYLVFIQPLRVPIWALSIVHCLIC